MCCCVPKPCQLLTFRTTHIDNASPNLLFLLPPDPTRTRLTWTNESGGAQPITPNGPTETHGIDIPISGHGALIIDKESYGDLVHSAWWAVMQITTGINVIETFDAGGGSLTSPAGAVPNDATSNASEPSNQSQGYQLPDSSGNVSNVEGGPDASSYYPQ